MTRMYIHGLARVVILATSLALVGSCDGGETTDDSGSPPDAPADAPPGDTTMDALGPMGDLPCDVAEVLAENCLSCHADIPLFGAPMALTSHAALTASTPTDLAVPVYEMVSRRINDTTMPMPPPTAGVLDDADRAILDAYAAAMAPTRPAGTSCDAPVDAGADGSTMMGGVGPEFLPCTPTHTITAHAPGGSEPFDVPATADNLYECFSFASPFTPGSQATAWAPIVDDARVLHHWILYRTETPQTDGAVSRCNMPTDSTFVMGWAPGGGNVVMPADVGMELGGPTDYYILQLHYWNVAGHTDATDASGVAICATDTPRAQEAGVMWLGSANIDIPPRTSGHVVTNTCPPGLTRLLTAPLNLLASGPHMHERGTHFITEIHPGGDRTRAETLVEVDPWDFNTQTAYPHPGRVLNPGDAIETRCTYDNPTDSRVTFGERTEDEMCFNFVTVYPLSAFPTDERRACLIF